METYHLVRTQKPELVFEGECIVRVEGRRDDPSTIGRWHDISIYRDKEAGWIVYIEYSTRCPGELPHAYAECVDYIQDIENVLLLCEPTEHVNRTALRSKYESVRKQCLRSLSSSYYRLADEVLAELEPHFQQANPDPGSPSDQSGTGRWSRLLGLILGR